VSCPSKETPIPYKREKKRKRSSHKQQEEEGGRKGTVRNSSRALEVQATVSRERSVREKRGTSILKPRDPKKERKEKKYRERFGCFP